MIFDRADQRLTSPTLLLERLGIDEPGEIAVEAIAQACGATIVYEPLSGCDARIVGVRDRAIITINTNAPRVRQRFSAAHELGHWMHDRGKVAFACAEGQFVGEWGEGKNPERRANRFAVDLLLPRNMFKHRARHKPITFATVRTLSVEFQTSLTATAIRLVEFGSFPAMLVCSESGQKRWSMQSQLVPQVLRPHMRPRTGASRGPVSVSASSWIDHPDAQRYQLIEDTVQAGPSMVLSLLWWKDDQQISASMSDSTT